MANSARWPMIRPSLRHASSLFCATPSAPRLWRTARAWKWRRNGTWLLLRGGWWRATGIWLRRSGREGRGRLAQHSNEPPERRLQARLPAPQRSSAFLAFHLVLEAVYNVGGRAIQIFRSPTLCGLKHRPDDSSRLGVHQKYGAPGPSERRRRCRIRQLVHSIAEKRVRLPLFILFRVRRRFGVWRWEQIFKFYLEPFADLVRKHGIGLFRVGHDLADVGFGEAACEKLVQPPAHPKQVHRVHIGQVRRAHQCRRAGEKERKALHRTHDNQTRAVRKKTDSCISLSLSPSLFPV